MPYWAVCSDVRLRETKTKDIAIFFTFLSTILFLEVLFWLPQGCPRGNECLCADFDFMLPCFCAFVYVVLRLLTFTRGGKN